MRPFSEVEAAATRPDGGISDRLKTQLRFIRLFVCVAKPRQQVVDHRVDHLTHELVTEEQFEAEDNRAAHVCPFVQTSIDRDHFYIAESDLTHEQGDAIQALILGQMEGFLAAAPAYDPMGTGQPVPAPADCVYKTWMTIFPNVPHQRGPLPLFDGIHKALKPTFMARGMMIGQFYNGCPWEQGSIYNPELKSFILNSPTPAFAMRYLVSQDKIFNLHPEEEPRFGVAHRVYFPDA